MPSFKPKTTKKIRVSKKNSTTLDGKHKEFINEFCKDEQDNIPRIKQERTELKQKLIDEANEMTVEQRLDIEDRINEITDSVKQLKSKKMDYFLDNSKFIFEYFENKKSISSCDISSTNDSKNKILNNFFKIKNENVNQNENKNKNIVQKYLSNIDETFLDIITFIRPTDICKYCFKGELIPLDDEGVLICNICSKNVPYLIENEKPSYKEPPKEV